MTAKHNQQLGNLLQERRLAKGWSARLLAQTAHVHPSTITRLEQGAFVQPKENTVRQVASALGISQNELAAITARYLVPSDLPEFNDFLDIKYPELSTSARSELVRRFAELHAISREVAGWND